MTKHRRFIPPQAAIEEGSDVASSPPAKERQKPELNDWEDEGGSLAEPPPSPRNRLDLMDRIRPRSP